MRTFSMVYPLASILPKICGWSGVFSGMGERPVETRIWLRRNVLRSSHDWRLVNAGKGRWVLVVTMLVLRASAVGAVAVSAERRPVAKQAVAITSVMHVDAQVNSTR